MKLLWLILLVLVSCSNESDDCSDSFKKDYQEVQESFKSYYQENPSEEKLIKLKSSLIDFLSNHKLAECELDGNKVKPTSEVESLLNEISSKSLISSKVIYGDDDRVDVENSPIQEYREWSESTAAHVNKNELDENYNIRSLSLREVINLCPNERFGDQLTAARCSGFLASPDLIVTAGHCMQTSYDCSNHYWVFGYKKGVTKFNEEDVYSCQSVVHQELLSNGLDYAVVKLDRPVKSRKFLKTRTEGKISDNTNLVVIGYPSGLPAKISDNGKIRSNENENWFSTNLDTFGGNSGSAVFNTNTGTVEGILVRGEQDYVPDSSNNCYKVNDCSNDGCAGEEVTRITKVKGIPSILGVDQISEGIVNKAFPEIDTELKIKVYGYNYKGLTIGGRKFLDSCAMHYTNDSGDWSKSQIGPCNDDLITSFLKKFISNP